jgi:hypothetical protein
MRPTHENLDENLTAHPGYQSGAGRRRLPAASSAGVTDEVGLADGKKVLLGPILLAWKGAAAAGENEAMKKNVCRQGAPTQFRSVRVELPEAHRARLRPGQQVEVEVALILTGASNHPCGQAWSERHPAGRVLAFRLRGPGREPWVDAAPWTGPLDCRKEHSLLAGGNTSTIENVEAPGGDIAARARGPSSR